MDEGSGSWAGGVLLHIGPLNIRKARVLRALLFHLYIFFPDGDFKEFNGSMVRDNAKSSAQ